jgi:hypothetical protein
MSRFCWLLRRRPVGEVSTRCPRGGHRRPRPSCVRRAGWSPPSRARRATGAGDDLPRLWAPAERQFAPIRRVASRSLIPFG